jgi:small-conductance mechanosensitive channel
VVVALTLEGKTMLEKWLAFGIAVVIAFAVALAVSFTAMMITKLLLRRHQWPEALATHVRRPFRTLLLVVAAWMAAIIAFPRATGWWDVVDQVLLVATLVAGSWFMVSLITFLTSLTLGRYRLDVADNADARRIRTQGLILERLAIALVVVVTLGAVLMTFPSVRTVGASLLASAGIASIVAGLAAQSALANMFAGIQLVFSKALRVDDVVVAGGEWGRVGEITLSYVVLNIWDERRLILPCTYFTTQPFENWTREGSQVLGSVELDLDWRIPVSSLRDHLSTVLAETELWDGRTGMIQLTDATGGLVRVRVLVSAADSGSLWDLRCLVRERLVAFVQRANPESLPTQRVLVDQRGGRSGKATEEFTPGEGLFSGSAAAEERHSEFTQSIPVVKADGEPPPAKA